VDFEFSDEQQLLRKMVRDFAEKEIAPSVMEFDESQEFPREIMRKAGDLGLLGILFPEEYGGAGLGYMEYALVVDELSRIDGSVGISVAAHNGLCTNHIYSFGTEEQRKKWVVPLAQGDRIGGWSLTEPTAGSDAGGTKTTARQDGDQWILNGAKTFCTHGTVGDVVVVFAVTDPEKGHHGISAFAIDQGHPGFRPGKKENKMGLRASDTSEVIMEDCRVGQDQMIGARGSGFVDAMKDSGMTVTKESAMAKLFASEIGLEVVDRALQIFGGYGYVKDFPAEKYYRDMKLCTIGEGTSEIQRLVIAREILKGL